jgi:hypothetical protein
LINSQEPKSRRPPASTPAEEILKRRAMRAHPLMSHQSPVISAAEDGETIVLVATLGGPTIFARVGIVPALNRHVECVSTRIRIGDETDADFRSYLSRGISNEGTSMGKLIATFMICALVWGIGTSVSVAGPHGCYRSQGCR